MESLKQRALGALKDLPDDVGIDEIFDRLYLIHKVHQGLQQAEAGDVVTQQRARERVLARLGAAAHQEDDALAGEGLGAWADELEREDRR